MEPPDPDHREQRMLAVAKLKRAASLPRMKDGRRPPMHVDGVSEGERANTDEELQPDLDTPPPEPAFLPPAPFNDAPEPTKGEPVNQEPTEPPEDVLTTPTASRSRRRSRSRTRSRGSKDKGRGPQSTPSPLLNGGDSSQDESFAAPIALPNFPPFIAPAPSNIPVAYSRFLRSPTPTGDLAMLSHPASRAASPLPSSPLPSLETLQTMHLQRSNSAAGRMMAMQKLTGGTDIYEAPASPSPTSFQNNIRRNNTISGGERSAARGRMFAVLNQRAKIDGDGELGSGGEQYAPSPSPTPKKRRRRSRRASNANKEQIAQQFAQQSDSEFQSTAHNTPIVPPTPLPAEYADLIRARSVTPSHIPIPRSPTPDSRHHSPSVAAVMNGYDHDRPEVPRRRSIVIEDDYDPARLAREREQHQRPYASRPSQSRFNISGPRAPQPSEAHSVLSTDTESAIGVPVYLSSRAPSRQDGFPSSPFITPLREKVELVEEDEQVLYNGRPRDTYESSYDEANSFELDREISWVASPVPEHRSVVDDVDHDEDDYEEEQISPRSSSNLSPREGSAPEGDATETISSRQDSSNGVLVESEPSPDIITSFPPASLSSAALSQTSAVLVIDDSASSPQEYPTRLTIAEPVLGERSPLGGDYTDPEDRPFSGDSSAKRGDSGSTSTWEKLKGTFTRSNSTTGRRSRTNSFARREKTDSSISRESGTSLSAKGDPGSVFALQQNQQPIVTISPSASASYVSLATTPLSRGGPSPVPPVSPDIAKYNSNSKLFPFPGIKKLEEQRNRAKGLSPASASTPDINALVSGNEEDVGSSYSGNTYIANGTPTPQSRNRNLPQQASDTELAARYNTNLPLSPPASTADYFDIPQSVSASPSNGGTIKLPMTLPGVKQWLTNKRLFQGSTTSASPPASTPVTPQNGFKKPSLTDIITRGKAGDGGPDWEEMGSTMTSGSGSTLQVRIQAIVEKDVDVTTSSDISPSTTPPKKHEEEYGSIPAFEPLPQMAASSQSPMFASFPIFAPSPPADVVSSATPDPASSLSDYPHETESSSSTSSNYSAGLGQRNYVLERLEETLTRNSRSPAWSSAVEAPPRKMILSSPVLQVVNANIVKDRFLFLFNDLLVIAKPASADSDEHKPAQERRFTVKSVVQLKNLLFNGDRVEPQPRTSTTGYPRNALIRSFIHQFSRNPDQALSILLSKAGAPDDPVFVAQILFKTLELDRVKLGEYISRKSSRLVLKHFIDSFGFIGLRVDKAMRVYLLSLHIPDKMVVPGGSEYLLDTFANRWYEANAGIVLYDKDLALRLVRAMLQLNEFMHGDISSEPGPTDHPMQNIRCRDFVDAFRRCDPRGLVPDETLEEIYESIRHERLCHARSLPTTSDMTITIKRSLPLRLTYKVQSEPIVLRIPQPDSNLLIRLYGKDLIFDPPVLMFHKSSEASFRVMGTSLGTKTMIMSRAGANALSYSGLPLSNTLTIERAFMRNTFQIAFNNRNGIKRRYMFSVDDRLLCHHWSQSLKGQIEAAQNLMQQAGSLTKFHRAAEVIGFKALQGTLIGPETSVIQKALRRLSDSKTVYRSEQGGVGNGVNGKAHVRSKSRSKMYHRGAGKNEIELNSRDSQDTRTEVPLETPRPDAPVWTGRELELHCLQNSSISLVLSLLQVGSPGGNQIVYS